MKTGSRYYPLYERLRTSHERDVALTFSEIEALIGTALPPTARTNVAWWSNRSGGGQASAWMNTKRHAVDLDLINQRVTFRRIGIAGQVRREGATVLWDGELIKALRLYMDMTQGQFAQELGMRQQTISEWEKGVYIPTRASSNLLSRVAKEAGFTYNEKE